MYVNVFMNHSYHSDKVLYSLLILRENIPVVY